MQRGGRGRTLNLLRRKLWIIGVGEARGELAHLCALHIQCASRARPVHMQCTYSAHAVHMQCTHSAHAVHSEAQDEQTVDWSSCGEGVVKEW